MQEGPSSSNKINGYSISGSNDRGDGSLLTEAQMEAKTEKPLPKLEKTLYLGVLTYGSVMLTLELISFFF